MARSEVLRRPNDADLEPVLRVLPTVVFVTSENYCLTPLSGTAKYGPTAAEEYAPLSPSSKSIPLSVQIRPVTSCHIRQPYRA